MHVYCCTCSNMSFRCMLSAKILEIVFVHLDACSLRNLLKYGYLDACSVRNLLNMILIPHLYLFDACSVQNLLNMGVPRRPPGASRWNPKISLKINYHSEHPP